MPVLEQSKRCWDASTTASSADMQLWRLTRAPYQALDGEGARLYGGRWNSEGRAVVYLASTLSLAALELLVHVDIAEAPEDLVALSIGVPDGAAVEEVAALGLPADWRSQPDHPACVECGANWLTRGESLLLRVPSALIPQEYNYLLNPAHPAAVSLVVKTEPFSFDRRLLK